MALRKYSVGFWKVGGGTVALQAQSNTAEGAIDAAHEQLKNRGVEVTGAAAVRFSDDGEDDARFQRIYGEFDQRHRA